MSDLSVTTDIEIIEGGGESLSSGEETVVITVVDVTPEDGSTVWFRNLAKLCKFLETHARFPSPDTANNEEKEIDDWLNVQLAALPEAGTTESDCHRQLALEDLLERFRDLL